ncbi:MAG: hypothetical protein MUF07_17500 [Steroidobacteraceae bacterium]|jgi:hypothetical protein|nr:hypothetical protein [Steroidobacteraceae bacterium]
MNDLALGIIVLTFAAVPLSLLVLAVADVIHLPDAERRHRWINRCLAALALPAVLVLGVLVWGWAGAAHLGPLCAAYATPEYRNAAPLVLRSLLIDSDQGVDPPWAAALLRGAGGPLEFVEYVPPGRETGAPRSDGRQADASAEAPYVDSGSIMRNGKIIDSPEIQSSYRLEARRRTHHRNRWFDVQMDRFRLIDRDTDAVLAEGDELWIRAGRATYHCGIGSGPEPTPSTTWPAGEGVARFVRALLVPRAPRP